MPEVLGTCLMPPSLGLRTYDANQGGQSSGMRVVEIAFGYPTAIFTTVLLVSAGYWILSMLLGFESGGGDLDLDLGGDVAGDVGADAGDLGSDAGSDAASSSGFLVGILQAFDLHLMPVALVLTIISLVGFLVSALGTLLFTSAGGSTATLVGVGLTLLSLIVGMFIAGKTAILLAPVFVPEPHVRRADLIGRLCTVRTGSVSTQFGQAEAVDSVSGSHIIQVRCQTPNRLGAGSRALIVSVDEDGDYLVSPDVDGLI